jgi:predicted enzyme related to lactoylglutathione lyase
MDPRRAPTGSHCWSDLWSSDLEAARRFYGELFGWVAEEPDPVFGGYFQFQLDGEPVVGCMGDMGAMKATDSWKPYLATDDAQETLRLMEAKGGTLVSPPHQVGELGIQLVFSDPSGAGLGAWEAISFPGCMARGSQGLPVWLELHTTAHDRVLSFYEAVAGWETAVLGDSEEFRYSMASLPGAELPMAGIFDVSARLPEGEGSRWVLYFQVDDVDASCLLVRSLGGSILEGPKDSPHGRLATVADLTGASLVLLAPPA